MQRPTAQPYSSVPVPAVPPGTTLEGKLKALGIQRPGLGAADGVVGSMRRALGPAAPSGASPGPNGPASPAPGPGDLRAAERAVQRAAARLEAAASNLKQNLASALPSRLDARASAAAPGPAGQGGGGEFQGSYDSFLARERERWGQGSWRREHTRAEGPDTKAQRASVEDAQVEAQRRAAEAKLMQLRREKGVSLQAELPASVAKRDGVAPLGARAAAEEAKKQKAAATVAQEAQEARDRAAREASALGLAASAAAKAAGMQPGDLERVRATLERDMQAHGIGAVLPARVPPSLAPTAAASGGAAPVAPRPAAAAAAGMAGTRSRGGTHDDPRKRREADAQAQRQRDAAASAATTYSTAALHAELEAEEAKAAAALAAAAAVAAASDTHVPLAGPGVPQCNAPYAVRREDSRLEVGWTTGASGDDVAAFQLQVLLPVPGAEWATLTDTAQASPLILERLVPGCPYQLRVRAKGTAGTWGPYSAPATLCTTGTRPQQWAAPPQGDAPGDGGDAPPGPGHGHGGGEYEAMFMRTAAFMASGAATAAATAAGTWAAPDAATVEHIVEALGDDAEPGQREQALAACVAHVRATIRAIRLSGLPADRIRRELRALRVRYHPDKAQPHQQWLYAELSKLVNAETRE